MRRIFLGFVPVFLAFMVLSCGGRLKEKVVETYDDGKPAKVRLFDRDGVCCHETEYYESGMVMMEGDMKGELREGPWKSYFPDGKVQSEGLYEAGVRIGKAAVYYENGRLYMEGNYKDGKQTGSWTVYDEQGYELRVIDFGD